jgi:hypothetical protein
MASAQYFAGYSHQSQSPLTTRSNNAHLTASIADAPWHQSPVNSAPSSGTSSQMFMTSSSGLADYTSPSPSSLYGDFSAGHQSPSIQTNHAFSTQLSPQVPKGSGCVRGLPERRKARLQGNYPDLSRRGSRAAEVRIYFASYACFSNLIVFVGVKEHPPLAYLFPPTSASRSNTPNNFVQSNRFQQQSTPRSMMPTRTSFHPDTSPSHERSFDQWNPSTHLQGHSRSTSSSDPRSASPAVSVASALTSISSARSAQNSHNFPPLHEPPPLLNENHRLKGRKMRLCNGDRKKMCLEHMANPELKQEQLAQMFSVERSTVSKILKNKEKWIAVPEADINRVAKHR